MMGAARGFPSDSVDFYPSKQAADSDYTPVLSRIRPMPYAGTVQFDLYFYNLSDPRAVPITSKMIPIKDFFHKKLGQIDPQTLKLTDLITELAITPTEPPAYLKWRGAPDVHRSPQHD